MQKGEMLIMSSTNSTVPSIECEAAEDAAKFLAQQNPQLAREFVDFMRKRGDERRAEHRSRAGGGRIRQGYLHWALWLENALPSTVPPQVILTDPVEAALFGRKPATPTSTSETEQLTLDPSVMQEIERQEAAEKAKREEQQRFLYFLSSEATTRISSFDANMGLSDIIGNPEIVTFEGKKAIFVYSYTVTKYRKRVRHDYRANGIPVTTKHPDMVMGEDGQRLIRSYGATTDATFYAKVLTFQEGMYFRGYFSMEGAPDDESLTKYFQVQNGEMKPITAAEYKHLENLRAAGQTQASQAV